MPTDIDPIIGANLRALRKRHRLTQVKFAGMIGITFQQLQKYENGQNRLAASRLYTICRHLGVSWGEMFTGLDDLPPAAALHPGARLQALEAYHIVGAAASDATRDTMLRILRSLAS